MTSAIVSLSPVGLPWQTDDPFLFCVHHDDAYPAGNAMMGPAASLAGRALGSDFSGRDGWSMYHGDVVPGFPQHPHRGFETVTIVRRGVVDHADSLGATARFGRGDAQWMTAGRGIVHAEMFPLLDRENPNPVELFQIWLNLPHEDKLVEPHFTMFWGEEIPTVTERDETGRATSVTVVAGRLGDAVALAPPPHSWAARPDSDVAIWSLRMEPGAKFKLPGSQREANRSLYLFRGKQARVAGQVVKAGTRVRLRADQPVAIEAGSEVCEWLLLQGKPIGEPIVQHGPFVMTTRAEIHQAFEDYRRDRFGGWPWGRNDPVHPRDAGRFARHANGRQERPRRRNTDPE